VAVGRTQTAEGGLGHGHGHGPGLVEVVEDESCRPELEVVHSSGRIDDDSNSKLSLARSNTGHGHTARVFLRRC
jgi:hypothetical protein